MPQHGNIPRVSLLAALARELLDLWRECEAGAILDYYANETPDELAKLAARAAAYAANIDALAQE